MKKTFTNITSKVRAVANKAFINVKNTLSSVKGEGYVDSGVKILIAVVIGALLLAGLYTLFNTTIMPNVSTKISNLFNYNGTQG